MRQISFSRGRALLGSLVLVLWAATEGAAQRPSIELLEAQPSISQDAINIVGKVKNIASREVSGVTVICDFQDSNGNSVRSEQTYLETDPLAPNEISQFKVSTRYSPQIKRFNFSFREMFGGPLVTKDSRK